MTAILSLLQSLQPSTPQLCKRGEHRHWCFKLEIFNQLKQEKTSIDFFRPFIEYYEHLLILYALNCSLIAKRIQASEKINPNKDVILEGSLKNALAMANLLYVINTQYFNSPQECLQLKKEEVFLRCLLRPFGYRFGLIPDFDMAGDNEKALQPHEKPFSKWFREQTAALNWPRLLIVRVKRVLDAMVPIFNNLPNFVGVVNFIDQMANPVFAYLAWFFYLPRLTLNLFLLLKNVLPLPWMSNRQQQLGYCLRLKCQLKDKWFELGNDSVWFTAGLVNCFVLVGSLAPWAMYLTAPLYAFDVILAGIRASLELNRLYNLRKKLIQLPKCNSNVYLAELNESIHYETQRLGLNFITTVGLFLGMLTVAPAFMANPIVPLAGAAFIVALCISTFVAGKYIEKNKPSKSLSTLAGKQIEGLFQPHQSSSISRSYSEYFIKLKSSQAGRTEKDKDERRAQDKVTSGKHVPAKSDRDRWRFHSAAEKEERSGLCLPSSKRLPSTYEVKQQGVWQ